MIIFILQTTMEPAISISLSEILVGVLGILAAGLGYIIKEQRDKINSIQKQLSEKKYKVYHEIYSIFFDLFKQQKGLQKKEHINTIGSRLIDIKKDLFIYAPDIIINKFTEWNNSVESEQGGIKHINVFLELFILIRKDMGHEKTEIVPLDILRSIMINDTEFDKLQEQINSGQKPSH
jgi:hypothetical protein